MVLDWVDCNVMPTNTFPLDKRGFEIYTQLRKGLGNMANYNKLGVEIKWIENYEGLYLIDNLGNVISVPKIEGRYIRNKYNVLKPKINKYGYVEITLGKDGKMKTFLLHRLIAKAFIDNPDNFPEVNHKKRYKIR